MWTKLMKCSFILGVFLLAVQSFAATELTLEQLRKKVLDDNLDIRVQYEKYYQSQRNIGGSLGQFLPSANANLVNLVTLYNYNPTLAILQMVPTPSNWFVYQASKELSQAQKYTSESIRLNILEGLTANYVSLKHQESLMESLKAQEKFLSDVHEEIKVKEEMGQATPNEVFLAKRNLLLHRQDIYSLETLMASERQSLLIALNELPGGDLTLGDLPEENLEVIPATVEDGMELAIRNSTELVSNAYQSHAASFMISSKKWSFISFNGIGFDYASNLAIEHSRARVIELQRQQIALKIKNQVFTSYRELEILDQRIVLQQQIVASNAEADTRNTELYENQAITLAKFLESKNNLISEDRALIKLEMQRLLKLASLKRLLGLDASLNKADPMSVDTLTLSWEGTSGRRGTSVWMEVSGTQAQMVNVLSVNYSINNVFEHNSEDVDRNFAYSYRMVRGQYELVAKITLVSGAVVVKKQQVVIE
jgi:outer membrane protein TolC